MSAVLTNRQIANYLTLNVFLQFSENLELMLYATQRLLIGLTTRGVMSLKSF